MVVSSKLTKITLKTLGQLIKTARLSERMSQAKLASRLDVSRPTVLAIENGSETVAIGAVFEAAFLLGIPLMADGEQDLSRWQAVLANFQAILPSNTLSDKKELSDDF
jgi:transcriptional regulator with XRE-family HTH domain